MTPNANGRFTGRHMTAIMIAFFTVVISVNLVMARMAGATFGGVVVENSYVASQRFNRWLDEAHAEQALGWRAEAARAPRGRIAVALSGVPAGAVSLTATARHPLGREADRPLDFFRLDDGRFISRQPLPEGRWRLRLELRAAGKLWRTEGDVR